MRWWGQQASASLCIGGTIKEHTGKSNWLGDGPSSGVTLSAELTRRGPQSPSPRQGTHRREAAFSNSVLSTLSMFVNVSMPY